MQEWIYFVVWSRNSLKTCILDKYTRKKEDRMCKFAIRNAGMKQDDISRVLNVSQSVLSRPLKEQKEIGSIRKRKRSTLILECKELLLKHYGTWFIIWRPPDTVKCGYWDFELSKVPGPNPRIWCLANLGLARWPEHSALRWHCKTSLYSHHRGLQKSTEHR